VAAFIDTIPAPDTFEPASAAAQVARGRDLFFSEGTQCGTCHYGEHFTDNLNHVIGQDTGPEFDSHGRQLTPGFQTAVLHGLKHTGPYLHDGSLKTLEDVVEVLVKRDLMGKGSHLSTQELADLVAYLKAL